MPGKIFVNYRRDDSAPHALNIAQYMERVFGSRNVFIDIDRIQLGEHFENVLARRLGECTVMLAIIGPKWSDARDEVGAKRLDNPDDWVRLEIARALTRNIKIIPILVGGATALPSPADLPDELRPLLKRQSAVITTNGFRHEMAGLANDVRAVVGPDRSGLMLAGLVSAALLLLMLGGYLAGVRFPGSQPAGNIVPGTLAGATFEAQLSEKCRNELGKWRSTLAIAAFAVASNGACGSSSDQPQLRAARTAALDACHQQGSDCRVMELIEGDWALKPQCETLYREWKSALPAKVFAVARSGHCAAATAKKQLEDARTEALAACERLSGNCRVHDADQGNWELNAACKTHIVSWRKKEPARAFAVARNGACAWSDDHPNPTAADKAALEECSKYGTECRNVESFQGSWELDNACRELRAKWTQMRGRGSFAAGQSGGCGYSFSYSSTAQADTEALNQCRTNSGNECKILERR